MYTCFSKWTLITLVQLTFACGPDTVFSAKTRGPSNVDWKQRFTQYKHTILLLPPELSTALFSWYDQRVFGSISATGPSSTSVSVQGLGDVNDLIVRLRRQAIAARESPTPLAAPSPALVQPTTVEVDPLLVPSIHVSGDYLVFDCVYQITEDPPAPGQTSQRPAEVSAALVNQTAGATAPLIQAPISSGETQDAPGVKPKPKARARRGANK